MPVVSIGRAAVVTASSVSTGFEEKWSTEYYCLSIVDLELRWRELVGLRRLLI